MKNKPQARAPSPGLNPRAKRTLGVLAALALVLILLAGGLLWAMLSPLSRGRSETPDLPDWLEGRWTVFALRQWDPDAGTLELDYPLRFTYEQMEKYGGTIPEVGEIPRGNLETLSTLREDLRQNLGLTDLSITLYGRTTDGQTAYTLFPDGSLSLCWEP